MPDDAKKKKASSRPKQAETGGMGESPALAEPKLVVEAVEDLSPPVQAIVDGLRAHMNELQKRLDALRPPELEEKLKSEATNQEAAAAASEAIDAENEDAHVMSAASMNRRRDSLKVWRSLAELRLADLT